MPLQETWRRIDTSYGDFSPQLRRAARYVRDNPQRVALDSLRTLAGRAGVSPTSMTRLSQALGFDNWEALQADHRAWLTAGRTGHFSERADRVVGSAHRPGAEDALLDTLAEAERNNIGTALATERRKALKNAADLIAAAPTVSIVGVRSCFAIAFSLYYSLSLFMPGTRLMTGAGGAPLDDLHHLNAGDALVAISVSPYSHETVEAARLARHSGVGVVSITDGALTPIARCSDVVLVAANDGPSHIASPIGPMALAQALAILALSRGGEAALESLRRREATLAATRAYVSDESAP